MLKRKTAKKKTAKKAVKRKISRRKTLLRPGKKAAPSLIKIGKQLHDMEGLLDKMKKEFKKLGKS